jgi:hypothetical protein
MPRCILENFMSWYKHRSARRLGNEPASRQDRSLHDQWWFEELLVKYRVAHKIRNMETKNPITNSHIHDSTAGRRFFITKKGYFGLGHRIVDVGDQVYVVAGGRMPFVLREHSAPTSDKPGGGMSAKRYTLLRDAYVHGIMYGEAMEAVTRGEKELQELVLV